MPLALCIIGSTHWTPTPPRPREEGSLHFIKVQARCSSLLCLVLGQKVGALGKYFLAVSKSTAPFLPPNHRFFLFFLGSLWKGFKRFAFSKWQQSSWIGWVCLHQRWMSACNAVMLGRLRGVTTTYSSPCDHWIMQLSYTKEVAAIWRTKMVQKQQQTMAVSSRLGEKKEHFHI